jgi:hypothetical protein
MKKLKQKKALFFLLAILAIATLFRFWDLTAVPPGLYPDVAINGNDALGALKNGDFKLFYPENNGREGLFINLIAFSFWLFGSTIFAIKLVPAIFGTLTVLGIYLLTRQLFSYLDWRVNKQKAEIIALLSSFFLAISFWHVNFSRLGFRAILVPFFLTWSFYFLFKLIIQVEKFNRKSLPRIACFALCAGFLFGLGFHTYISFRIAPLILIPTAIFAFINYARVLNSYRKNKIKLGKAFLRSYFKDGWFGWDLFFLAIILAALPMALYFYQHPADFAGRTGQVSILSADNPAKEFAISAIKTLGQFVAYGDQNWRHNDPSSPQIFWPVIPLFLIGLGYSFWQILNLSNWKKKNFFVLQVNLTLIFWWGAMLAPAILTREGLPHSLRSIGSIPPSYIFAGLGAYLFLEFIKKLIRKKKTKKIVYGFLFLCLILLAGVEFWRYFIYWGKNPITRGAFTQEFVDQANYLNSLPETVKKYVMVNEGGVPVPYPDGIPMSAQTIIFLTNKNPDISYLLPENCDSCQGDKSYNASATITKPTVFLPLRYDEKIFNELKAYFPDGQIEAINDFSVFKINF